MRHAVERDDDGMPVRLWIGGDLADVLVWQLRAVKVPTPQREFRFCARRWRFDLAWPNRLLAVEVNGAEFSHGRHNRGLGMAKDFEKLNAAQLAGWTVLQFTGKQVKDGIAVTCLENLFQEGAVAH